MSISTTRKIDSVQFLRALAVLLVVHVHVIDSAVQFNPAQKDFYNLENWGAIGLDLFFVISGFIMTIVTPAFLPKADWKTFLVKRALRIVPLYWLLSLVSVGIQLLNGHVYSFEKVMKTMLFFPFFDTEFVFPIIPVGWSLSLEVYFYALIAALLVFSGKHIYTCLIAVLLIFAGCGFFYYPETQMLKFLFSPLLIEFALGVLAGMAYRRVCVIQAKPGLNLRAISIGLSVAGAAFMLASLFAGKLAISNASVVSEHPDLALLRSIIWGIPCATFLTGIVLLEKQFNIRIPKIFISLGDASYSCYLIHTLLLIPVARKVYLLSGIDNGDLYILFTLLFVQAGSWMFYLYIERGLNSMVNSAYSKSKMLVTVPVKHLEKRRVAVRESEEENLPKSY